ncbi:MAG: MgtC/SapB family protein [Alphaproteobacteria bacterium]|jgi:putative Mg2+ transporter-C (MgtC) family protein|nr:MgtC/SapB family protein [Alphaproteobacteria bacterium]
MGGPVDLTLQDIALRLAAAVGFGMLLGLDRELRGKSAGMRTHMLVALGAALTALVSLALYEDLLAANPDTRADPLRIIEGVIGGIGFLGAGAIIRGGGNVRGMTSAANIWLCGAIGLACGVGFFRLAGMAFVFTFVILTVLQFFEKLAKAPERKDSPSGDT